MKTNNPIQSLPIHTIMIGGNVFGWTVDEYHTYEILDSWFQHGIRSIDTSDNYSHWANGNKGGESETLIGKWLTKNNLRNEVFIATKFGGTYSENKTKNISAKYARQALERSLNRLQTDYIDLYQVHHDDGITPVEETMEVLNEFVLAGKVKHIGVSNMSAKKIAESMDYAESRGISTYETLQPEYNYIFRDKYQTEYADLVAKYQLGVIPYFSLASGLLTGKYKDENDITKLGKERAMFMEKYLHPGVWEKISHLEELSRQLDTPISSLALKWLLQQQYVLAPIVSVSKVSQINDLLKLRNLPNDINF